MYIVSRQSISSLCITFHLAIFQYYRKARQMALHAVFPEFDLDEDEKGVGRLSYPRPISEPPSPTSSRATTPIPSDQSDEDDEVDEEREVNFGDLRELNFYRLGFSRLLDCTIIYFSFNSSEN